MRMFALAGFVAVVVAGPAAAQEAPKLPAPQKEHEWLKQFEGEWVTEAEAVMEPGKPPVKMTGAETTRSLGGFWLVTEMKCECFGVPMTGVMTVGYDPAKKKYVGTWVCSADSGMIKYEGSADGKKLTLECEGPSPHTGKTVKMKDVIEVKDKDTKLLTSLIQGEDGKWTTFMTLTAKRKK